jgi:DNA-binding CsgD family transcriptional regulator
MDSARRRTKSGESKASASALSTDAELTPREHEILARIVVGHSSKEVARSLDISPRTVEFHRSNLRKKFSARNTADLVRKVSAKV